MIEYLITFDSSTSTFVMDMASVEAECEEIVTIDFNFNRIATSYPQIALSQRLNSQHALRIHHYPTQSATWISTNSPQRRFIQHQQHHHHHKTTQQIANQRATIIMSTSIPMGSWPPWNGRGGEKPSRTGCVRPPSGARARLAPLRGARDK